MIKWNSRLLAGIFIPFLSDIYVNNSAKTSCYKTYKKMILLRAQINKKEI